MSNRLFTEDHEWISVENGKATIGVSAHAADELGEVVFVELPNVGTVFSKGDECASVESVKTVSGVYAPINGTVVGINQQVVDSPDLINQSPYDSGWLIQFETEAGFDASDLMDEASYEAFLYTI
jgi:glycine cleavage system H protein